MTTPAPEKLPAQIGRSLRQIKGVADWLSFGPPSPEMGEALNLLAGAQRSALNLHPPEEMVEELERRLAEATYRDDSLFPFLAGRTLYEYHRALQAAPSSALLGGLLGGAGFGMTRWASPRLGGPHISGWWALPVVAGSALLGGFWPVFRSLYRERARRRTMARALARAIVGSLATSQLRLRYLQDLHRFHRASSAAQSAPAGEA